MLLLSAAFGFSVISENRIYGGVAVGKGGAVTADATGASALFYNPAGMSESRITNGKTSEVWAAFGMPYESVSGINLFDAALAYSMDVGPASVGIGLKSSGDLDSLSYQYIYLSGSTRFDLSDFELPVEWASVGASLKTVDFHVANIPSGISTFVKSDSLGFTFDAGLKTGWFGDFLIIGLYGKNLAGTSISLVNSGTGDTFAPGLFGGLKFNLTPFLNLTMDYDFLGNTPSVSFLNLFGNSLMFRNLFMGLEFSYYENVKIYCGFNEGSLTLGASVSDAANFIVDAGFWIIPGLKMFTEFSLSYMLF